MGFRHVEPEPREPQPAVPLRWVALGTVGLLALSMLPVFFGLILGFVSVLDTRVQDRPVLEAREFHHSELEPKKRVYPEYPEAAKPLNLPPQRCLAVVSMDTTGTPVGVQVDDCPAVFVAPTREAMLKWRWYPPTHNGRPVRANTTIAVTYKVNDDPPPNLSAVSWAAEDDGEREARRYEARARLEQRRVERIVEAEEQAAAAYGESEMSRQETLLDELDRRVRPVEPTAADPVRLDLDLPED